MHTRIFTTSARMETSTPPRQGLLLTPLIIKKSSLEHSNPETIASIANQPISSVKIETTSIVTSQNSAQDLYLHNSLQSSWKIVRATHSFDLPQGLAHQNPLLTLDDGNLFLVHAAYSSGWIDGTSLATGSRGWLPGNLCEIYKPEKLCFLFNTLLCFQDLRSRDLAKASDCRKFIGAIAAGVRVLLVRPTTLMQLC